MLQADDLSRSLADFQQESTLIAVIEMSQSSWLAAGIIPGVERHALKKIQPAEETLLQVSHRWRAEASKTGHMIRRIAIAFEAGRDGFWSGALATGACYRNPCHSSFERGHFARTSSSEDRSA